MDFYRNMPKVELHAHLGGSISDSTLKRLLQRKGFSSENPINVTISKGKRRTIADCFEIFRVLHEIITDEETIKEITKDVIGDFAKDGVCYLELRSNPRDFQSTGLTKKSYIQSVLGGIEEYEYEHCNDDNKILVQYLPSIRRDVPVEEANQVIKLAKEFMLSSSCICGIDYSGNPYKGDSGNFIETLLHAKNSGLNLAIHTSEIDGRTEDDKKLSDLPIDRIGHGTYIHKNVKLFEDVCKRKIPIELCLTSNIKTKTSPQDPKLHHLTTWLSKEHNHPCVICTDDKGVFATSLSNEYQLVADALGYSQKQMFNLALKGIDYAFIGESEKAQLRHYFLKTQNSTF